MPQEPYIINGTVYQSDGITPSSGNLVKLFNETTGEVQEFITNSSGQYVFDCGNFTKGYTEGDYIKVIAAGDNSNAHDLRMKIIARDTFQISELKIKYKTE